MVAAKRAEEVWITFRGKQRQVKPRGIREPKGRVKRYRVEIRPPRSKSKIWVGTFETRHKAQRAYDVAVYLIGKEPYYHLYPGNYFPRRPTSTTSNSFQKLKKLVQKEAKMFAEKNSHLLVNPSSLVVEKHPIEEDLDKDPDDHELWEELDDQEPVENMNYRDMDDQEPPVEDVNDQEPVENMNYRDMDDQEPPVEDVNEHLDDQEVMEDMAMPAAYLRGLKAADPGFVNDLLAYPPPESFTVFSSIQGGEYSILDLFEENPASRLIPSPAHTQFDCVNWSPGFEPVDGEGGYDDHTLEEPWW